MGGESWGGGVVRLFIYLCVFFIQLITSMASTKQQPELRYSRRSVNGGTELGVLAGFTSLAWSTKPELRWMDIKRPMKRMGAFIVVHHGLVLAIESYWDRQICLRHHSDRLRMIEIQERETNEMKTPSVETPSLSQPAGTYHNNYNGSAWHPPRHDL